MIDRGMMEADRLEADLLRRLDALYAPAIAPVIERHMATLKAMERLEKDGKEGLARARLRSSGLIDDLADALAALGHDASAMIRDHLSAIREVAADDDGVEA